jgi:hypothetical protein
MAPQRPSASRPDSPPQDQRTRGEQSNNWKEHEHVAPPVEAQAQKLLEEAGSPAIAKHAIDAAAQRQPRPDSDPDQFARHCGFDSRTELFSASTKLTASDGAQWWATPLKGNGWVVWSDRDFRVQHVFTTFDDARRSIAGQTQQ